MKNMKNSKNSRNEKGKGKDYKKSPRKEYEIREPMDTIVGNDPMWHNPNNVLFERATNVPFGMRVGDTLIQESEDYNDTANIRYTGIKKSYRVPGIAVLTYAPTVGWAEEFADPVNMAKDQLYTLILQNTGRTPTFSSSDLFTRIIAYDNVLTGIAYLKKIFYTINWYDAHNKMLPRQVIGMLGCYWTNLIREKSQFAAAIDDLVYRANTLNFPATYNLFRRHVYMAGNYFKDRNDEHANIITFRPQYLLKFERWQNTENDVTTNYVGCRPVSFAVGSAKDWKDLVAIVSSCLDALYLDESTSMMNADILKVFGENQLWRESIVEYNATIVPTYDERSLNMIHNATVVPIDYHSLEVKHAHNITSGNIQEYLVSKPCSPAVAIPDYNGESGANVATEAFQAARWRVSPKTILLDFHLEPTNNEVMEGTRLITWGEFDRQHPEDNNIGVCNYTVSGTEIITDVYISAPSLDDPELNESISLASFTESTELFSLIRDLDGAYSLMQYVEWYYQISHLPILKFILAKNDVNGYGAFILSNTSNVTTLNPVNMERMNTVSRLGLYDVARWYGAASRKAESTVVPTK